MQKEELISLLDDKFDSLIKWLETRPDSEFVQQKVIGKWSNGEHLEHLRKTTRAVNKGMRLPKLVLRYKFGKMNRPERSYEEIQAKYIGRLRNAGVKAPKEFSPANITIDDRARIISWFLEEKLSMQNFVQKASEKQLSKYVIPHPLIGKMSFREFVYFTAYHTEHHFQLMKKYNG